MRCAIFMLSCMQRSAVTRALLRARATPAVFDISSSSSSGSSLFHRHAQVNIFSFQSQCFSTKYPLLTSSTFSFHTVQFFEFTDGRLSVQFVYRRCTVQSPRAFGTAQLVGSLGPRYPSNDELRNSQRACRRDFGARRTTSTACVCSDFGPAENLPADAKEMPGWRFGLHRLQSRS